MAGILGYIPFAVAILLFCCTAVVLGISGSFISGIIEPDPLYIAILICAIFIAIIVLAGFFLTGLTPISSAKQPTRSKLIGNVCIHLISLVLSVLNVAWFAIEGNGWSNEYNCEYYDQDYCGRTRALKAFTVISMVCTVVVAGSLVGRLVMYRNNVSVPGKGAQNGSV